MATLGAKSPSDWLGNGTGQVRWVGTHSGGMERQTPTDRPVACWESKEGKTGERFLSPELIAGRTDGENGQSQRGPEAERNLHQRSMIPVPPRPNRWSGFLPSSSHACTAKCAE